MTEGSKQTIASVERAADVLTLFATIDAPDLGVTEVANQLQLSKAVVHRLLTTLVLKEYLVSDARTRRYRLGPMALALGVAYTDRIDIRRLAQPYLRALSESSNETATLSLRQGWSRLYIDQITPSREVKMTVAIGRPFPLHAGGSSKAFLAFLPQDEIERYINEHGLEELTDLTVTDPDALRCELKQVRESGYAVSLGERQAGAGSVAAPVLDRDHHPVAVMSVCGPVERFREEVVPVKELLLDATRRLSRELGRGE
jgi:IclR family transcriptional regulator, acetate operon repressor